MEIMFRLQSPSMVFKCVSGCQRLVYAYTRLSDKTDWREYCDKCMALIPWAGVDMYLEYVLGPDICTIYNTQTWVVRQGIAPEHDFRLNKI